MHGPHDALQGVGEDKRKLMGVKPLLTSRALANMALSDSPIDMAALLGSLEIL